MERIEKGDALAQSSLFAFPKWIAQLVEPERADKPDEADESTACPQGIETSGSRAGSLSRRIRIRNIEQTSL